MKHSKKIKSFLAVTISLSLVIGNISITHASKELSLWANIKNLINSLLNNEEGVPNEEFSFLEDILKETDEKLKDDDDDEDGIPGDKVWWKNANRGDSYSTYEMTNWAVFEGMRTTLLLSPSIKVTLDDDLERYEEKLDDAAKQYQFAPYKELFKAIAMYRHTCKKADIFKMEESSVNLTPGKKLTVEESIDMAAKLFASCLRAADYPDPYEPEGLKALLQAFEFEHEDYIEFSHNKYTLENAENYASQMCDGKLRKKNADTYGKYDYGDQKFPDKVLQYYSSISINAANIPAEDMQHINELMASWGAEVTQERKKLIEKGLSLYGLVTYSMPARLTPTQENPTKLDCSSFVGWSYYYSGHTDVQPWFCTGNFLGSPFRQISADQLIPGDIGLINWVGSGGSNHVGIYMGKDSSGQMMWLHCTSHACSGSVVTDGPRVSYYSAFSVFFRYSEFS